MANRLFHGDIVGNEYGMKILAGKVAINSSAAVSSSSFKYGTITKTATGAYTLTLEDSYVGLVCAQVSVLAATAVDLVPQIVSADVVTAKTVVVKLLAGATATDPSAACELHILLVLKDSTAV